MAGETDSLESRAGRCVNQGFLLGQLDAHPEPSRRGEGLVLSVRRPQERVLAVNVQEEFWHPCDSRLFDVLYYEDGTLELNTARQIKLYYRVHDLD